jgi:hypothetical protein
VTIRDIVVKPWNTNYEIEIFYSPSEGKTYSGKLPDGVKGEFGSGLRTLILTLYHVANVSEPKIHEFLENMGVRISRATIFRIVTEDNDLFDKEISEIFHTGLSSTTYQQIDERISKTREKKGNLLLVLIMPEIPLHNNAAELAARAKVRKRDVSLQTVTDKGTKANDTFMTIVQTAKKLSVSTYNHMLDRVSNKFEMLSLAQLIKEKSSLN